MKKNSESKTKQDKLRLHFKGKSYAGCEAVLRELLAAYKKGYNEGVADQKAKQKKEADLQRKAEKDVKKMYGAKKPKK